MTIDELTAVTLMTPCASYAAGEAELETIVNAISLVF
jgi:hypothetical protein